MPEIPQSAMMFADDAVVWGVKLLNAYEQEKQSPKTKKAKKILEKKADGMYLLDDALIMGNKLMKPKNPSVQKPQQAGITKISGRYFINAEVPPHIRSLLRGTIAPQNRHMTLKFLGDLSEKEIGAVKIVLNRLSEEVAAPVKHVGYSNATRHAVQGVYHAEMHSSGLQRILNKLNRFLPTPSSNKFKPHITLSIGAPGEITKFRIPTFRVKKIQLMSSDGQHNYTPIHEVQLKKKAEYAPGIPSRHSKELPRISEPQAMRLAIQSHKARRAGHHYDVRIVDEKTGKAYSWAARNLPTNPGDKTLAILQPTHTAEYSTWSGKIESGYGAGDVELFSQDKIEVTKAEPQKITFNVYKSNGDTERYAMINTSGDQWLFHNVTPTRTTRPEIPNEKPHYKSISPDTLDPNKPNEVWSPKIDGALNVFRLVPDKPIETYSYRPSAKGINKLIDHTFRIGLHRTIVPTAFKGHTVVLGEVFARDRSSGNVLPSTDTSARLLSNVWRSRELQQHAPLDNVVFNVLRYNGRDVSAKPYAEKLQILKQITAAVPQLKMPPLHTTEDSKFELMKDIKAGKHPLTGEGVVVYKLNESIPLKSKLQQDYDVFIRGVFPGEGKYKGKAAGGFTYSFKPAGKIIGKVGTGLSDTMRTDLWKQPKKYTGSVARIFAQQQLPSGSLRMPVFKDIRSEKFAEAKQFLLKQALFDTPQAYEFGAKITIDRAKKIWETATQASNKLKTPLSELNKLTRGERTALIQKHYKVQVGKEIVHGHMLKNTAAPAGVGKVNYTPEEVESYLYKKAYPAATEPSTNYPLASTNLHEIGKTQGADMPDPNVQMLEDNPYISRASAVKVKESRKFLRKKADASAPLTTGGDLYMSETPKTQNFYQDITPQRITEHIADNPSATAPAMTATKDIGGRKVRIATRP